MAASRPTAKSLLGRAARRVHGAYDRFAYPEAEGPGEHWQRLYMNELVLEHLHSLSPPERSCAEISGSGYEWMPWRNYESLNYPQFDLCAELATGHERFDVVICEQVLEHVVDPVAAAANLRNLCTDGGRVVVSTPFLIRIHELLEYGMYDYWRFTPRGLTTLLDRAGLEVDSIGSWGNRQAIAGNLSRWSRYRPWHSMRNEPDLPVQVWAFAHRRPAGGC